jgi:hypothetical protein
VFSCAGTGECAIRQKWETGISELQGRQRVTWTES